MNLVSPDNDMCMLKSMEDNIDDGLKCNSYLSYILSHAFVKKEERKSA